MKRIFFVLMGIALLTVSGYGQSLGEVARQERAKKTAQASKVYDNDNLPKDAGITVGTKTVADTSGDTRDDKSKADSGEKNKATETETKAAISEQKKKIAQLERELSVAEREWKMRGAVFYSDAGNQLRDSKKWMEEQRKSQAELDRLRKELADAKQKLEDMREVARKAGLPASAYE
jgi:hypothetical protein